MRRQKGSHARSFPPGKTMKMLIVSHSCVAPVNQRLYAEVERQSDWRITLVCPSNWRDEYGRQTALRRDPGFGGGLVGVPVILPGNIILHAYRTGLTDVLRQHRPDVIYVNHEPYAAATAQVYLANHLTAR